MPKQPRLTIPQKNTKQTLPRPEAMATSFHCSVCLEDHRELDPVKIDGDFLCHECFGGGLKPQFLQAAANEAAYPVRWGATTVDIAPLRRHFDKKFLQKWSAKVKEYDTAAGERLYCAGITSSSPTCGAFLGSKAKHRSTKKCGTCQHHTCADCSASFISNPLDHTCATPVPEADPFEGLERGVVYQRCPGCDTPVELRDGCNHITCRMGVCKVHFCFLCGEQAVREDGHWAIGKPCPFYNRPGEANAQYDAVVDNAEDAQDRDLLAAEANEIAHILGAEIDSDDDPSNDTAGDPPELRLRRADRRWVHNLRRQLEAGRRLLNGIELVENADQQANRQAVLDLLMCLHVIIGQYTIHLEQDPRLRAINVRALSQTMRMTADRLEAAPRDTYIRYPRLADIIGSVARVSLGADVVAIANERLANLQD